MAEAQAILREEVYTEYPEHGDGVYGSDCVCHGSETGHVSDAGS